MNIKTGIGRGRRKNNVEIYCTSNAWTWIFHMIVFYLRNFIYVGIEVCYVGTYKCKCKKM